MRISSAPHAVLTRNNGCAVQLCWAALLLMSHAVLCELCVLCVLWVLCEVKLFPSFPHRLQCLFYDLAMFLTLDVLVENTSQILPYGCAMGACGCVTDVYAYMRMRTNASAMHRKHSKQARKPSTKHSKQSTAAKAQKEKHSKQSTAAITASSHCQQHSKQSTAIIAVASTAFWLVCVANL